MLFFKKYNISYFSMNTNMTSANDQPYWNDFYQNKSSELNNPSDFCTFVMNYFKNNPKNFRILDAGCGNGRDSYVLSTKYNVVGADNSGYKAEDSNRCCFEVSDFVTMPKDGFDLIYSRFTFHSITNANHETFLKTINKKTYLCIETRSDKGISSERHYGDDHYRNFTNVNYLKDLLEKHHFQIELIKENVNMAIYKNENPWCIRVICRKIGE